MIVVGLTGKAGSGKTEVANYLVEKHGFTKLSFAAPLKQMLRTLDPILSYTLRFDGAEEEAALKARRLSSLNLYEGREDLLKESGYGDEYRRLLQVLGTDCIRAIDEDFWVRAAMKQLTDPDGRYVFDDVRFPNEAQGVRYSSRAGGLIWRVVRPNHDGGAGAHESEQHSGKLWETLTITNYSSKLGPLHEQIDYTMEQVFGGVPA